MSQTSIKPIETHYRGYRFRSRLEARWAVFFDWVGIKYRYEHDGFPLKGIWYLPDFWMPEQNCWYEIKPTWPTSRECEKAIRLCKASGQVVHILAGDVWPYAYSDLTFSPNIMRWKDDIPPNTTDLHWPSSKRAIRLEEKADQYVFAIDLQRGFRCHSMKWATCPMCNRFYYWYDREENEKCLHCGGDAKEFDQASPFLRQAYIAARSARFERGGLWS